MKYRTVDAKWNPDTQTYDLVPDSGRTWPSLETAIRLSGGVDAVLVSRDFPGEFTFIPEAPDDERLPWVRQAAPMGSPERRQDAPNRAARRRAKRGKLG